ncbi:hypothetical protein KE423_003916 [Salmonella enterica]|nr:hypothetical protein [Salmonella enterica]
MNTTELTAKRVKHFVKRAASEGHRISEHDARRLVPRHESTTGGWSYSATLRDWLAACARA